MTGSRQLLVTSSQTLGVFAVPEKRLDLGCLTASVLLAFSELSQVGYSKTSKRLRANFRPATRRICRQSHLASLAFPERSLEYCFCLKMLNKNSTMIHLNLGSKGFLIKTPTRFKAVELHAPSTGRMFQTLTAVLRRTPLRRMARSTGHKCRAI